MQSNPVLTSLYFDSKNIYAAELTRSGGKPLLRSLTRVEIAPTSDPASKDKAFREAVLQTIEKAGLRGKKAVLALPGSESIIRYFEMPLIPLKEAAQAVHFEAQKYVPFDIKDLCYDFEILPDPKKKLLRVIFLAAKKDLIGTCVGALKEAGLEVIAIEPDALSVLRARSLDTGEKGEGAEALISARDDGSFEMVIAKNNIPLTVRNGTVLSAPTEGNSRFERCFESFAKEMTLSLNYFSKNFKNEEVRQILWCAEADYEPRRWTDGLRAKFEIPAREWNLTHLLGKTGSVYPAMAVAIGAALRPVGVGSSSFFSRFLGKKQTSLLPAAIPEKKVAEIAPEDEKKVLVTWTVQTAIIIFGVFFLIHQFLLIPKISSAKKTAGLVSGLSLADLTLAHATVTAKMSFLSGLEQKRVYWTEKLSRLARDLPEEIQLTGLEAVDSENLGGVSAARLILEGNVLTAQAGTELTIANLFVNRLLSDKDFMKGFNSVVLTRARKEARDDSPGRAEGMSFAIECATKKTAGAA